MPGVGQLQPGGRRGRKLSKLLSHRRRAGVSSRGGGRSDDNHSLWPLGAGPHAVEQAAERGQRAGAIAQPRHRLKQLLQGGQRGDLL